jgi:hypothetical protein
MIIMSFVMPMKLTLRNGASTDRQITFSSPMVISQHNTYPIHLIIRIGVGPSMLGGSGNDSIIKSWVLPAFNHVTEFFEELCTNY